MVKRDLAGGHAMKKLSSFSLITRIAWLTGGAVLLSTITTQRYFMRHERAALELRLREKASFVNNFYAFLIADALQHNDDVTLLQVIDRLEQDPEISSVVVVDGSGEIRYDADPEKIGAKLDDPLIEGALKNGEGYANNFHNAGGQALALVSPLKVRGQAAPQGAVRIDFTYRHIIDQVHTGQASFHMTAMGTMASTIGIILWGFRLWVLRPMQRLKGSLLMMNPAVLEANLPESDDEFGQMNATVNNFISKIKAEWSAQRTALMTQSGDERVLIEQLVRGLMPEARVLIADKQNRLVCDTGSDGGWEPRQSRHLLDLVTDSDFSTLIRTALQKEGEVTSGAVSFENQPYQAAILIIPEGQSKVIRTVIALKSNSDPTPPKEAV